MKYFVLPVLLWFSILQAQPETTVEIAFDTPFYAAAERWVLFPASDENIFSLGFIYIDRQAGFTFDYLGDVIKENGKLKIRNIENEEIRSLKVRLQRGAKNVYVLTKNQLEELDLKNPNWLEIYKTNSETDAYKIDIASTYNSVGGNEFALEILLKIKENNLSDEKLLFELVYAYNALGRHNEALEILETAFKVNDSEELFYKEQLYAQVMLFDFEAARAGYEAYVEKSKSFQYRTEMLYNLCYTHFLAKNREEFDFWSKELRLQLDDEHLFAINLNLMELYWDEPRD